SERGTVRSIIARHLERAGLAVQMITAVETRAVGEDRAHARLLRRQPDVSGDIVERALVANVPDEIREAVGAGDEAGHRHPPAAIDVGEGLVEARLSIEPWPGNVETACGARKAF